MHPLRHLLHQQLEFEGAKVSRIYDLEVIELRRVGIRVHTLFAFRNHRIYSVGSTEQPAEYILVVESCTFDETYAIYFGVHIFRGAYRIEGATFDNRLLCLF
jgi:hypothetical protein